MWFVDVVGDKNLATGKTIAMEKHTQRKSIGGDTKLIPRVREYLRSCTNKSHVDLHSMVIDLQHTYCEYRRKKRVAFKAAVMKAYDSICEEGPSDSEQESTGKTTKEIKNDKKPNDDSSDFSVDNDRYVVIEDTNAANNSLRNLYDAKKDKNFSVVESPRSHSTPTQNKNVASKRVDLAINRTTSTLAVTQKESKNNGVCLEREKDSSTTLTKTTPCSTNNPTKKRKSNVEATGAEAKRGKKIKDTIIQKPTVTFADIGGNEKCVQEICKLLVHLKHPEVYRQLGVPPPRGLLLHGPPGCGKTLLANAIAGELDLPFLKIAATEIVSGVSGESEEKIRELFERAVSSAPCVLFIDEIDSITPKRETAQREMERRIVAQLLTCMDDLNSMDISTQVLVIGATNRPDSLDPALRRAGRFDREISLGIPDSGARARILHVLCRGLRLSPDVDFNYLSNHTPGYVGADLMALTREAAMSAVNRIFQSMQKSTVSKSNDDLQLDCPQPSQKPEIPTGILTVLSWLHDQPPLTAEQLLALYIESQDFEHALKVVQPSAKREGFATVPDVSWSDIGALHSTREELQLTIMAPIKYPDKFRTLGLTSPAGILLCGPPGCGKTLLAKAIANESGINFISVKGPELLNMYVGESERAVRQCFQRARSSAPCIIFFDELDALCSHRSDSVEGGSGSRVVNQLLTEMDGVEGRKGVFILGATNRPDIIDPAVLRPGRLDKILYVGLPTVAERVEILKTITKNGTIPLLDQSTSLEDIGTDSRCTGFTGADLSALVREASVIALKEFMVNCEFVVDCAISVKKEHFESAFSRVRLSVSPKQQAMYENVRLKYCNPGPPREESNANQIAK